MFLIEKKIPNLLTFGNLFCGFFGILACFHDDLITAGIMIFIGAVFDLFDGMAARLFKVNAPIGKQLDTLADVVTFGLLPSFIVYGLLLSTHVNWVYDFTLLDVPVITLLPFLITAGAAWRLAKFNIDDTQTKTFRGLPSPANGMFFASFPLMRQYDVFLLRTGNNYLGQLVLNPYVLLACTFLLAWLMISDIRLFSFKLKSLKWADSKHAWILIILSVVLFAILLWGAIPLIIFLYIILSFIFKPDTNEVQSAD
jgi:CDP-diacylglycerol--serine O-phosphatidyltransferase